jgi:hypothetical protein
MTSTVSFESWAILIAVLPYLRDFASFIYIYAVIDADIRLIPNVLDGGTVGGGRVGGGRVGRVGGDRVRGGCDSGRACIDRRVVSENGCGARGCTQRGGFTR